MRPRTLRCFLQCEPDKRTTVMAGNPCPGPPVFGGACFIRAACSGFLHPTYAQNKQQFVQTAPYIWLSSSTRLCAATAWTPETRDHVQKIPNHLECPECHAKSHVGCPCREDGSEGDKQMKCSEKHGNYMKSGKCIIVAPWAPAGSLGS